MEQQNSRTPKPYDWALSCLRVPQAQRITKSDPAITVAVIDLGYSHHPHMDGRLWTHRTKSGKIVHGWDAFCDDDTLMYDAPQNDYHKGHHVFVAGEIANVAPLCKIMIVRVGYGDNPNCWARAVKYAQSHGASIIVMPHGYIAGEREYGTNLFYLGGDFCYPYDNEELLVALDEAYANDCMIFSGTCDNRGRRIAGYAACESIIAVGSSNRHNRPSDICTDADYTEMAAPGGQRSGLPSVDHIYGYGGEHNMIYFTGGCMACGFAGGVAALVRAQYPTLSAAHIRQIMCNTAVLADDLSKDEKGWNAHLGYGVLDAHAAVSIPTQKLCKWVSIVDAKASEGRIECTLFNKGVFSIDRVLVTVSNGHPRKPPGDPKKEAPPSMTVKQLNHTIVPLRGFSKTTAILSINRDTSKNYWIEAYPLDAKKDIPHGPVPQPFEVKSF